MINIYNTPKDWEFGVGVSFPSKSIIAVNGSFMYHYFRVYIFFGPWTVAFGEDPVEITEEAWIYRDEYENLHESMLPVHGTGLHLMMEEEYRKYKAFWEHSRMADKISFELHEWEKQKGGK